MELFDELQMEIERNEFPCEPEPDEPRPAAYDPFYDPRNEEYEY